MGNHEMSEVEESCVGALAEIKSCSSSDQLQFVQLQEEERRPITRLQSGRYSMTEEEMQIEESSDDGETGVPEKNFDQTKNNQRAAGRWSVEEHEEFLRCLRIYGREWKKVSQRITTRTAAQIRSHAQKYFKKLEEEAAAAAAAAALNNRDREKKSTQGDSGESFASGSSYSSGDDVTGAKRHYLRSHSDRRQPTIDEAIADIDQVLHSLEAKRARCLQTDTPTITHKAQNQIDYKRPRANSDDWLSSLASDDAEISQRTPSLTVQQSTSTSRKRVVSCDDLGDNELIALEMLCRPHHGTTHSFSQEES
mmetsp:Transcript_19543/g.25308  ORF Transcript_19543/g.25308 Transcript_19543/m.25308 type:complete len:309 (+) Transcript_19543:103-1029(+)